MHTYRYGQRAGAREEWNVRSRPDQLAQWGLNIPILARLTSCGEGGAGLTEAMIELTYPRAMSRSSLTFPDARRVSAREDVVCLTILGVCDAIRRYARFLSWQLAR